MDTVITIDPSTGEELGRYPTTSPGELERVIERAGRAGGEWGRMPIEERADALRAMADAMQRGREELAALATAEMGKPITEARAEVDKCAWGLRHAAEIAPRVLSEESLPGEDLHASVRLEPLGTILAIMPWNYPYWQVVRAAASVLAAGNTLLLKHADGVTGCALALGEVARQAGLPDHVLQAVVLPVDRVGGVIGDPRVAGVTLTGSVRAGRAVAAAAGAALKPAVLELGGSDPFIVLEDADVEAAAACAVRSRFQNNGQTCIAAKRAIVARGVYGAFRERVVERMGALRVGDPSDETTDVGPMARHDLRDLLARQVAGTLAAGARLVTGGSPVERPGFFFAPTLVEDVPAGAPAAVEELFGPALALFEVAGEEEAVALANATEFGLGSNVWTADLDRGRALAARLRAGHTAVNGMTASDPRIPFGGVRSSGYGRELGRLGLQAFVNVHAIVVHGKG